MLENVEELKRIGIGLGRVVCSIYMHTSSREHSFFFLNGKLFFFFFPSSCMPLCMCHWQERGEFSFSFFFFVGSREICARHVIHKIEEKHIELNSQECRCACVNKRNLHCMTFIHSSFITTKCMHMIIMQSSQAASSSLIPLSLSTVAKHCF